MSMEKINFVNHCDRAIYLINIILFLTFLFFSTMVPPIPNIPLKYTLFRVSLMGVRRKIQLCSLRWRIYKAAAELDDPAGAARRSAAYRAFRRNA